MQTSNVIPFPARQQPASVQALYFPAQEVSFPFGNKEWAELNLPPVRAAVRVLSFDSTQLEVQIRDMGPVGARAMRKMLEEWDVTAHHLAAMIEAIGTAHERVEHILDKLGLLAGPGPNAA